MATFCYRCPQCEARYEIPHRAGQGNIAHFICDQPECLELLVRDYRAESANINTVNLRSARG